MLVNLLNELPLGVEAQINVVREFYLETIGFLAQFRNDVIRIVCLHILADRLGDEYGRNAGLVATNPLPFSLQVIFYLRTVVEQHAIFFSVVVIVCFYMDDGRLGKILVNESPNAGRHFLVHTGC